MSSISPRNDISFILNGKKVVCKNVDPKELLIDYLRSSTVNLTGTKLSCGEGGCGACTVIWSHYDYERSRVVDVPINSCLRPLCSLDGTAITTVEGLPTNGFGPVIEEKLIKNCGSQCGYCSPGFVMTMYGLLKKDAEPNEQQVEDQFGGNICRCTGYISILNAMQETARCTVLDNPAMSGKADQALSLKDFSRPEKLEIIYDNSVWYRPITLKEVLALLKKYQPVTGRVKIVQGNTSVGIYKADYENPNIYIDVSALQDWKTITEDINCIHLSGGVTIGELLDYLNGFLIGDGLDIHRGLRALRDHIKQIAGVQVRGAASVAGSLMMVKNHELSHRPFPGDLFTVLTLLGATISYWTPQGKKHTCLLPDFPPLSMLASGFLIYNIDIPFNKSSEFIGSYRVARRTQNSHPIVNAAFKCEIGDKKEIVSLMMVFGGISRTALELEKTQRSVLSKKRLVWDASFYEFIKPLILEEISSNLAAIEYIGITDQYKKDLTLNLFYKFFVFVAKELGQQLSTEEISALDEDRPVAKGFHGLFKTPYFVPAVVGMKVMTTEAFHNPLAKALSITPVFNLESAAVGEPSDIRNLDTEVGKDDPVKIDSPAQVRGQAKYTHDLDVPADTLNAFYVYSENRNATFSYVNGKDGIYKLLQEHFGDVHYITADDIPVPADQIDVLNYAFPSYYDPIFADSVVTCFGQPIGIAVAKELKVAKAAAELIQTQIVYGKSILETVDSLEKAREMNSVLRQAPGKHDEGMSMIFRKINKKDSSYEDKMLWMDTPFPMDGKIYISGGQQTGAQYHFYMEPQGAVAIPKEGDDLEVFASTQNQASCQKRIARLLGVSLNRVKVGTTRLGGGFGGKELRQVYVAAAAAVAATTLKKPVRLLLNRNVDMRMQGMRHPFDGKYSLVADQDGKIERMRLDYESDAGHSFDCSYPVMDLALLCAENAYDVEVFKSTGKVYRTNFQSRTAFRSFGLVQSMLITENAIEHLAFVLKKLPEDIRKLNFYSDGVSGKEPPRTPYGSKLKFGRINKVWDTFKTQIDFDKRSEAVVAFNQNNKWKKRGISMIPLNYGISYTYRPMNQGSAYVIVYKEDGSVMLHHGGVEMGQGIHTKMVQIAATELDLPIEFIRIGGTNTSIIPNVSSTGASTGSDLNGGAVQMACRLLKQNMMNFIAEVKRDHENKSVEPKYPDISDQTAAKLIAINQVNWRDNWLTLVGAMAVARQSLSTQYSFGSPKLGVVKLCEDGNGNNQIDHPDSQVFYYYNNCVAVSEVEIDVLTGKFEILQSDIVYDAGDSLNDHIDIGQIEGGFIQGVGCLTTEEMLYGTDGRVISDGTWEYKPPCSKTIPQKFNVWLLKYIKSNDSNDPLKDTYGINSSKSTGEPPLVLANTVFFAIKHAIAAARADRGNDEWFELSAPATIEKIQQNCLSGN